MNLSQIIKTTWIDCPCCNSRTAVAFALPQYPVTELFRLADNNDAPDGFIDQAARYCENCGHFFLEKVLDPSVIYSAENYVTSSISSKGAVECINEFVSFMQSTSPDFPLDEANIVDIGGNDSTLLKCFLGKKERRLINIDPHATSNNPEIEIENHFLEQIDFSHYTYSGPTAYVSSHTFEHVEDPAKILRRLSSIIKEKDLLFLQFPSVEKLIENFRFDQICHQHLHLFSLNSITALMKSEGLFLQAYEFDNAHFGTIRLKFSRKKIEDNIRGIVPLLDIQKSFERFANFYRGLNESICDLYKDGQGFGAGLMVPTLAYHLPVINELSRIVDENPSRIGKKFVNLAPEITDTRSLEPDQPTLITSISTKAAARAIFQKLDKLGFKDICLPTITT